MTEDNQEVVKVEHAFPFDPTYGYTQATLLAITPPKGPDDFAAIWKETATQTAEVPLSLERERIESGSERYETYRVFFDTWGGYRIGGWLIVPPEVDCGMVIGHGYGGRAEPDYGPPLATAVCLFPCAPGFDLSARADLPDNSQEHVVYGIESRETYLIRPCVAAFWSAVTALVELCPQVGERIFYMGGSFGGGLGALALPWEPRFKRAHLSVPTFGHHPLRVECPCEGSGKAVRNYYQQHPEVMEVLQYYDAATAAGEIDIPVHVSPALFDPAVPPPGQFAVYNGLEEERELFVLQAGHFEFEGQLEEQRRLRRSIVRFFGG